MDVAIRIGWLPDSSLIAARIGRTTFAMCGSPEYLAGRGVPCHPDDLRHHEVLGHVAPSTAIRFTYRFIVDGAARAVNLPSRLTLDDGEALVSLGVRSLGLVMANDYLMEPHLRDGSLVRVLGEYEMPPVPISAVHLPSRTPSPAIRALVAMLRRRSGTAS